MPSLAVSKSFTALAKTANVAVTPAQNETHARVSLPPCLPTPHSPLPVSLSPCLPVSLSPCLSHFPLSPTFPSLLRVAGGNLRKPEVLADWGLARRLTFSLFGAIFALRGGSTLVDLLIETPAEPL